MRSINTKNYITSIVYLLAIVALIVFGILPFIDKLSTNQANYSDTRKTLDSTLKKYTQLTELSKNEQEILSIKEDVYELIPNDSETANFVVKLEAVATDLSIPDYISSISTSQTATSNAKTAAQKQKDAKKEVSYSIGFTSNYTTIKSFLDKLYDFPRFTTIKNINISGYNSEQDTLSFKINGVIYYGK